MLTYVICVNLQGTRYYENLNYTAPRLEEVVVSCKGEERIELLRQLLVSLRGTERISGSSDEVKTLEQALAFEPRKAPLVSISSILLVFS